MIQNLIAQVKAVNRVNKAVLDVFPVISEALKNYVGKRVLKADGNFIKKVAADLPNYQNNGFFKLFRHPSYSSTLNFTVSLSEHINYSVSDHYEERIVFIGEMDCGVLVSLCESPEGYRTDYTIEEILSLRRIFQNSTNAAEKARNALHHFGECD